MIDLEWCEQNASKILERDIHCRVCGQLTTTYRGQTWASVCGFCGSIDVVPIGGLLREPDRAQAFMLGEE